MINVASLAKIDGVLLDEWFIPTMFNALELDNSAVLWTSIASEYYLDTTNNLLKIKFFNKVRRSFDINAAIVDGTFTLRRNAHGNYYPSKNKIDGFRLPKVDDLILANGISYTITEVVPTEGDITISLSDTPEDINALTPPFAFIDGTYSGSLFADSEGVYYSKHYRSSNLADIYIDGADIRSIAGRYF